MAYLGPSQGPDDWRGQKTDAELRDIERAAAQRAVLSQANRSDEAPQMQRLSDRIRPPVLAARCAGEFGGSRPVRGAGVGAGAPATP
jgi:hypothetical protein